MANPEATRRLGDWFRQWRSPLRKFLIGKTSVRLADLDDVAQEVFLRLLRYERSELVEHPQAYLFKMASNVAAEWSLRARHSRPHEPKWLAGLMAKDQPEGEAVRARAQLEVERAINTLSARHREVLKLQFTEELSYAQIAERLGTTPRAVKRSIARSYEKLRAELDSELLGALTHGRD